MFSRSRSGEVRPVSASSAAGSTGRALEALSKGEGSARSFTDRAISLRFAPPKSLLAIFGYLHAGFLGGRDMNIILLNSMLCVFRSETRGRFRHETPLPCLAALM